MSARRDARRRDRAGFTLVEVIVALAVLGIGVVGLSSAVSAASRRANVQAWATARNAALLREAGRVAAMPYTSLPGSSGCDTTRAASARPYSYARCTTTLPNPDGSGRRITIIVASTAAGLAPDTVVVFRTAPNTGSLAK